MAEPASKCIAPDQNRHECREQEGIKPNIRMILNELPWLTAEFKGKISCNKQNQQAQYFDAMLSVSEYEDGWKQKIKMLFDRE